MARSRREVFVPDPYQGVGEIIVRSLDVSANGSNPTGVDVSVFVSDTMEDVTATVMPSGSPSITGDVITLPALRALNNGISYRHEVLYVLAGNTLIDFFFIHGQL